MKNKKHKQVVNNPWLRENIENMNKERKKTFDFFFIITGYERMGKSTMALQICKEANPDFGVKDVAFNLKQFSEKLKVINERAGEKDYFPVLMYDEAGQGLYNRLSGQRDSMAIALLNTVLMQVGFLRGLFVLILPNFFVLDNYVREHRVTALIHVYRRGNFIAFGKKKVELVSVYGKNKQLPYFIKPDFRGTFTKYNPLGKDYFKAELKNKQDNINNTLNQILNTFQNIKSRVACPRCNSGDLRYNKKTNDILCRKCGNVFLVKRGVEKGLGNTNSDNA